MQEPEAQTPDPESPRIEPDAGASPVTDINSSPMPELGAVEPPLSPRQFALMAVEDLHARIDELLSHHAQTSESDATWFAVDNAFHASIQHLPFLPFLKRDEELCNAAVACFRMRMIQKIVLPCLLVLANSDAYYALSFYQELHWCLRQGPSAVDSEGRPRFQSPVTSADELAL